MHDAIWGTFQSTSIDDIKEFTESVLDLIGKTTEETVPKVTVKTFPNQKPWINKTIRDALNMRTATYNSGLETGNMDDYKAASYNVRKAVREAKRKYGEKVESQFQQCDPRKQGLRSMTDYKGTPPPPLVSADASLADELNTFHACFEASSSRQLIASEAEVGGGGERAFTLSEHVRRTFQ